MSLFGKDSRMVPNANSPIGFTHVGRLQSLNVSFNPELEPLKDGIETDSGYLASRHVAIEVKESHGLLKRAFLFLKSFFQKNNYWVYLYV